MFENLVQKPTVALAVTVIPNPLVRVGSKSQLVTESLTLLEMDRLVVTRPNLGHGRTEESESKGKSRDLHVYRS